MFEDGGSSLLAPAIVRYSVQRFTCMLPGLYSYGGGIIYILQGHYKIKQKLRDCFVILYPGKSSVSIFKL